MTDDLIAFLKARLDEDERAARAATAGPWSYDPGKEWFDGNDFVTMTNGQEFVGYGGPSPFRGAICITGKSSHAQPANDAMHIARHDPARVLREVEAKRRVLEHNAQVHRLADPTAHPAQEYVLAAGASDYVLRLLAVPYADHPDYREEWRP